VGLHGLKEDWVHPAVNTSRHGHGGRSAADQLGRQNIVATLLILNRCRYFLPNFVSRAPLSGVEWGRRFGVEHVTLLADVDLGLAMRDLEMIVALLEHLPERHVRRIAVPGHVERRHPERKGLDLERFLAAEKGFPGESIDFPRSARRSWHSSRSRSSRRGS